LAVTETETHASATHVVPRVPDVPDVPDASAGAAIDWASVPAIRLAHFHERSAYRPDVSVRIAHDGVAMRVRFDVANDRGVLARPQPYNGPVCTDSCVEFFVRPGPRSPHYINFEASCAGVLHASCIPILDSGAAVVADRVFVPPQLGQGVVVGHSMPAVVQPELPGPVDWHVELRVPFAIFAQMAHAPAPQPCDLWHANFYHCADHSSLPRWASWTPQGTPLNFHRPAIFGQLRFG
jgi:hypothetical protein